MPSRPVLRLALIALALAAALGLAFPATAQAAPNCSQVPAPPACGSNPTPKPIPAPTGYSSARFAPDFSKENYFVLVIQNVPVTAVAGLSDTQLSNYRASISCTNGYFASARLARGGIGAPTLSFVTFVPAGTFGSGSCIATTWDRAALAIAGSSVTSIPVTVPPFGSSWLMQFD